MEGKKINVHSNVVSVSFRRNTWNWLFIARIRDSNLEDSDLGTDVEDLDSDLDLDTWGLDSDEWDGSAKLFWKIDDTLNVPHILFQPRNSLLKRLLRETIGKVCCNGSQLAKMKKYIPYMSLL